MMTELDINDNDDEEDMSGEDDRALEAMTQEKTWVLHWQSNVCCSINRVHIHIHKYEYILICREVGALEMVELIQGVRLGLGQYQISIFFFLDLKKSG